MITRLILTVALCAVLLGCEQPPEGGPVVADPMKDDAWAELKAKAVAEIEVAPGWSVPRLVPGEVNSTGWEDSGCISPDGQTLYFSYIPCDFHSFTVKTGFNLEKFADYRRGPNRGNVLDFAFDTFEAKRKGDSFGKPNACRISVETKPPHQSETGLMQSGDNFYYAANAPTTPDDSDPDIWRDRERLPFNTSAEEHDPHYIDGELFFWSQNLPGSMGRKDLWMTTESDGAWSKPVLLAAPVNSADFESWQPHLTKSGKLYYTSNQTGPLGIWMSKRKGKNSWSKPERVVWPSGKSAAIGIAEPSLTEDETELYFCVLFKNAAGSYDLDIAFSRRLP